MTFTEVALEGIHVFALIMLSPQAARAKQFLLRGAPRTAMDASIETGEVSVRGDITKEDLLKLVKALRQNAAVHTIE